MESGFLEIGESKIFYYKFGEGSKLLISFPGFADQASLFFPLQSSLYDHFTVYSIDLPFHGKSEWQRSYYRKTDFMEIIHTILKKEEKSRFSLMGFSYGGRLVLANIITFAEQLERIFLIAPYGLLASRILHPHLVPRIVRLLIWRLFCCPQVFIRLIKTGNKLGLISRQLSSFASFHFRTKERRDRLFGSWVSMLDFVFFHKKLKRFLRKSKLRTDLFMGQKDRIIPVKKGEKFSSSVPTIHLHILNENHQMIGDVLNSKLEEVLRH